MAGLFVGGGFCGLLGLALLLPDPLEWRGWLMLALSIVALMNAMKVYRVLEAEKAEQIRREREDDE